MNISTDRLPLRISALLLLHMGESRSDVSRYLGVSRVTLDDRRDGGGDVPGSGSGTKKCQAKGGTVAIGSGMEKK